MLLTSWEIDFEKQRVTIVLSDGQRQGFPLPEALMTAAVPFLSSRFDFSSNTLSFKVASGDDLIVELGAAGASEGTPAGRPVVFSTSFIGSAWRDSVTRRRSWTRQPPVRPPR